MKARIIYIFIISCFIYNKINAQSCLPNGITFTTQSQIDSFPINYPGCSEIEGFVHIFGDISNLDSLIPLSTIGGDLFIAGINVAPFILLSLNGLDSLHFIGGDLRIEFNYGLSSLNGLNNLAVVEGSIKLLDNFHIQSLLDLENLSTVKGDFSILGTEMLTTTEGLENLTFIGGNLEISYNYVLTSLTGLSNLFSIGGNLTIQDNNMLPSLSGLDCIDPSSITELRITDCPLLSECNVQSICNYLNNGGTSNIFVNSNSCNSVSELEFACMEPIPVSCQVSIENLSFVFRDNVQLFPNPTKGVFRVKGGGVEHLEVTIRNQLGNLFLKKVLSGGENIDISELPSGLYFVELKNKNFRFTKRILKNCD